MNIGYNELAHDIYQQNKAVGWWDNPDRCIYETLQLVSTEIAEATEGERKDLMDNHLPHRKNAEVELADALIRVLDLGGRYGWDYIDSGKMVWFEQVTSVAGMHLVLNMALVFLTEKILFDSPISIINMNYSALIRSIIYVSESRGYDINEAMMEKLEYNKQRADHKRENRAKEHGKKF